MFNQNFPRKFKAQQLGDPFCCHNPLSGGILQGNNKKMPLVIFVDKNCDRYEVRMVGCLREISVLPQVLFFTLHPNGERWLYCYFRE